MSNISRAREILQSLARQGLSEVVICAGARNAPFVALLDKVRGLKVHAFFDERSAGFFALGRARASGRPIAVCTTSGTAVAELLPAVIEADYQSLPLIVLSADRPVRYRGTGAPQTIVQPGIFSAYVEKCWDIDGAADDFIFSGTRPIQINVCFDEPLVDEVVTDWSVRAEEFHTRIEPGEVAEISSARPLVVASGLSSTEAQWIAPLLNSWGRPVYAEATSQLRGHAELAGLEIRGSEPFTHLDFDGVIRIGGVPTLRFWRDLETSRLPVWHFSKYPLSGLPREKKIFSLSSLLQVRAKFSAWAQSEKAADQKRGATLSNLLSEFPLSEPAFVRRVSGWLPHGAMIFLGNSLPIREWDLCAVGGRDHRVEANRGANGIDGLVSTFLGLSEPTTSNWAMIGDLSALYDLSGLWAARLGEIPDLNLLVLNNGGGKIFERMFKTPLFENRHSLEFSGWAKMFGWDYLKINSAVDSIEPASRPRVIEIVPDSDHTRGFYDNWERQR